MRAERQVYESRRMTNDDELIRSNYSSSNNREMYYVHLLCSIDLVYRFNQFGALENQSRVFMQVGLCRRRAWLVRALNPHQTN